MLTDEELAEVVSEALTSDVVARAETTLLGADAVIASDTERIAQLDSDRRLVELLGSTGFEGEQFDKAFRKMSSRLIGYAFPIMKLWVREGRIFGECLKYRGHIDAPAAAAAAQWSESDRAEVVNETIVRAIDFFLDYALRKGKWDYRRGATLTTYFIGACVCAFIKVCNDRWKQQQLEEAFIRSGPRSEHDDNDNLDPVESIPDMGMDPANLVALRDEAARTWSKITDDQVRRVLALRMTGMTQADAAVEVGLTAKAAERRLHTQRRKLRPPSSPGNSEDEARA
jgi:DNA-directed RNA polymerase specialized sigma24 family protein